MSLLKVNEVQNFNGSSLTLTASTVSTSAQLNTGGNISVTGSLNVSDDSTTRSNLGLGSIATQASDNITVTGGTATLGTLTVSGSDSGNLVRITQTGTGNALVVEDETNPDSNPFVIDANGTVGIGTSSPSSKLEVIAANPAFFGNSVNEGTLLGYQTGIPSNDERCFVGYVPSSVAGVNGDLALCPRTNAGGKIVFFTGSTTASKRLTIDASGNIGAPTGSNIYNASDERLKQNITDLSGCLQKVLSMRGVSFNWIDQFCDSEADKTLYGLIAQELQIVDSNLVDSFSNNTITAGSVTVKNPLRVNEKFIIPMLVESIKEQQSQILSLTGRIEVLEATS